MNTPVITIGLVFAAAAIIGGGLEAAGTKVPVISTKSRQVLLGLVGVAAVLLGYVSGGDGLDSLTRAAGAAHPTGTPGEPGAPDSGLPGSGPLDTGGQKAADPEYHDVVFTTPAPQDSCLDSVGVTFTPHGPSVDTQVLSANVGNFTVADLFYDFCQQQSYEVSVTDNDALARYDTSDGKAPDGQACALRAQQQPVGRTLDLRDLRSGMGFCLISPYQHQVVHVVLTGFDAAHDLRWTATGWHQRDVDGN